MTRAIYHTFLLDEWNWRASGIYIDPRTRIYPVEGDTRVFHQAGLWIIEATMRIVGDEGIEFTNRYEVTPLGEGADVTTWRSYNPALGRMEGCFVLVDDSVISLFETEDGRMRGGEYFRLIDDDLYWNRGTLTSGGTKVSSWSVELRRL